MSKCLPLRYPYRPELVLLPWESQTTACINEGQSLPGSLEVSLSQGLAITGAKNLDQNDARGHGEDREQPRFLLQGVRVPVCARMGVHKCLCRCVCRCMCLCVLMPCPSLPKPGALTHLHGLLLAGAMGLQGLRGEVGLPGIKGKLEEGAWRKWDVTL